VEGNGLLAFLKMVLFPLRKEPVKIKRAAKFGGDVQYATYEELEKAFAEKQIHPLDLKAVVAELLNILLAPIRKKFCNPELIKLVQQAYPADRSNWQGPGGATVQEVKEAPKPSAGKMKADMIDFVAEHKAGRLGKLAKPVLKEYCKQFGLQLSGTKDDLFQRVEAHLISRESS